MCKIPDIHDTELLFRYVSYSIESLKRIVENQGGMTFIPELATVNISPEYEDMIKTIEEPVPVREISAAYLKTTGIKRMVQILLDTINDSIPSRMKTRPRLEPLDTKLRL
jgi:LysR family hydrogen peroxide-inducible transcriptional activator